MIYFVVFVLFADWEESWTSLKQKSHGSFS